MTTENTKANDANRALDFSRLLNAPRDLVFEVWTDPKHIINWWGPTGFTNTIYEMNVKTGGVFRFMMHGPDGKDYPNVIEYTEVVKPEKLVWKHSEDGGEADENFEVTVTFEEEGSKTRLNMRMVFKSEGAKEFVVKRAGAIEGNKQTMDKLEAYLADLNR